MADMGVSGKIAQTVSNPQGPASSPLKNGASSFDQLMQKVMQPSPSPSQNPQVKQIMSELGITPQSKSISAISGEGLDIKPTQISATQEIRSQDKIMSFLTDTNRSGLQLEEMVSMISSNQSLSSQDLLAIQASMYGLSQQVELTGKVVEVANSGFKQTYNTQI